MEKTTVPPIKVNYSNGSNLTPNQQMMFKNLEWGINLDTSTMYLSYEIDQDQLYAVMTSFDNFVRLNPKQDIKLNIPDERVAVLLSGGVDSLSVALAADDVGKQIEAYSFYLKGNKSYDFQTAENFSKEIGWSFTPVEIPRKNIIKNGLICLLLLR